MTKKRYTVSPGNYIGTSDDVSGRWYIIDTESNVIDKRGKGLSYRRARRQAKLLNQGMEPSRAAFLAKETT